MSAKQPTIAQARILAWAIYRAGGRMYVLDWNDVLTISDETVRSMLRHGWAEKAQFYNNATQWRWTVFYVSDAARGARNVVDEVARLRALDDRAAARHALEDALAAASERLMGRLPRARLGLCGDKAMETIQRFGEDTITHHAAFAGAAYGLLIDASGGGG